MPGRCHLYESLFIQTFSEWVSPAAVTYLIHRMVETEGEYDSLLSRFNVYILPVVNPDGYEYSRNHDRMWRKTRSRTGKKNLFGNVSLRLMNIVAKSCHHRNVMEWTLTGTLATTGEGMVRVRMPARKPTEDLMHSQNQRLWP